MLKGYAYTKYDTLMMRLAKLNVKLYVYLVI